MPPLRSGQSPPRPWLVTIGAVCLFLLCSAPALAQTGTVSGTVTDDGTGAPVSALSVALVTLDGAFVSSGFTNASGAYTITAPIGALYYVVTGSGGGYLSEAFPNVPCLTGFCSSSDLREAEPLSIMSGGSVTGRNFGVTRGGTITGTVTNASGTGVANVFVFALTRFGTLTVAFSTSTNFRRG